MKNETQTATLTAIVTGCCKMAIVTASLAVVGTGCTKSGRELHKEPNIEVIQDMMEQPALKPQDAFSYDRKKGSSRLPPDHTVPVGYEPYPYHLDPVAAAKSLKNPLAGDMSPKVLDLGRTKFETYCAVCHGYKGAGDGPVAPKMALKPPPLISDKVVGFKDAEIFHIITDGQGVMSSYEYQLLDRRLSPEENAKIRWAMVNYVRSLQQLAGKKK